MLTTLTVDVLGSPMALGLARIGGANSSYPGIVLCHHREGVDEFTLDAAQRIAGLGFVVAIPNFYHRLPPDADWNIARRTMQDTLVVADLKATYDFLTRQSFVRADAIGIVGHCMGGRTAFLGAAVIPAFKAAAILYGGHIFKTEGEGMLAPINFIKNIQARVLALYGDHDHVVDVDEIRRIEDEMKTHNIKCQFHVYKNAGHAFQDFTRPEMYCEEASEDSWTRLLAFLMETLA